MTKKTKIADLPIFDAAEFLESEEDIAMYLAASMEDDDPAQLAVALGTVARARGMAQLARDTGLTREALYRSLSGNGNPSFATVSKVMRALGFKLVPQPVSATTRANLQPVEINHEASAEQTRPRQHIVWLTGLSGAGKTTIANLVAPKLLALGKHAFVLDGDNMRRGLNKDLGFTRADRIENVRRAGEVAKLMSDAGLTVIVAFISPFRAERELARRMAAPGEFIEVFIDTPLQIAEQRDVKGLYRKARAGELKDFTGIDSPYEAPESPDLHIDTTVTTAEQAAELIVQRVQQHEPAKAGGTRESMTT